MKQSILQNYFLEQFRRPTQRVKIPCGTKRQPERIKMPRAEKIEWFEIKEPVIKSGLSKEIDRVIQTAFYLGVPVEQICNKFSVNYGTDGSVLITADTHIDIRAKTQEQKEKLLEAINDKN